MSRMTPNELLSMQPEDAWEAIDALVDTDPIALRDLALALLAELRVAQGGAQE